MKIIKRAVYLLWIAAIIGFAILYLVRPELFEAANIKKMLEYSGQQLLVAYLIISLARGFFLIPNTPFVIAGAIIFPDQPIMVFIISMVGVLFSASLLYYFSDALGFSDYLEKRYPKKSAWWKNKLSKPQSIWIVIVWSLFPLVPTDLICYAAGIVKMKFRYLFIGVFVGEVLLICSLIYFGQGIYEYVFS